jgi:hypothetical protein
MPPKGAWSVSECRLIIPPEIIALKLRPIELLILAEIVQLSKGNGYCWAHSNHFCDRFNVSQPTVIHAIKSLTESKYLAIEKGKKVPLLEVLDTKETCVITKESCVAETKETLVENKETLDPTKETLAPSEYRSLDKKLKRRNNTPLPLLGSEWDLRVQKAWEVIWSKFPKRVDQETAKRHFLKSFRKNDRVGLAFIRLATEKFTEEMNALAETNGDNHMVTRLSAFYRTKMYGDWKYDHLRAEAEILVSEAIAKEKGELNLVQAHG